MGSSIGSFFYDYACLKDALRNENFDIIYEAGYTTIVPAYIRFNVKAIKRPIFVTNMDGLEYKRTKYNKWVQKFVYWEEQMAVKHSRFLIADNMGIHDYYKEKYGRESKFLAYGANIYDNYNEDYLKEYGLERNKYLLIIARQEPENNLSMAIDGYISSEIYGKMPLVIVGKKNTPYGKYLVNTYSKYEHVMFTGGIYNFDKLNSLRYFSYAYFHGHSVGGTNPSLLEAMASECFILSHNNIFNKTVLGDNAIYYNNEKDVANLLNKIEMLIREHKQPYTTNNLQVIRTQYSWEKLVDEHEEYFMSLLSHTPTMPRL